MLIFQVSKKAEGQGFPSGCVGYCGSGIAVGIGVTAGVLVGVGVALAINHEHHTLTGCVSAGPNGLEVQTNDAKTYSLKGNAVAIKAGDRVKLHGSRKKPSGSTTPAVFEVKKLSYDYGPCPTPPLPPVGSAH